MFVLVLTVGLAGCSGRAAPAASELTVFLTPNITDDQRSAVAQTLGGLPRVANLTRETRQEAYARFKEQFKDAPDLVAQTKPDSLPESLRATVTDATLTEAIEAVIAPVPGVSEVIVTPSRTKVLPKTVGVIVQLDKDIAPDRRSAIEQRTNAFQQDRRSRFEPSDTAYRRLKKVCAAHPTLARAIDPAAVPASYRFTVPIRTIGTRPFMTLNSLDGVRAVLTVPSPVV